MKYISPYIIIPECLKGEWRHEGWADMARSMWSDVKQEAADKHCWHSLITTMDSWKQWQTWAGGSQTSQAGRARVKIGSSLWWIYLKNNSIPENHLWIEDSRMKIENLKIPWNKMKIGRSWKIEKWQDFIQMININLLGKRRCAQCMY